MRALLHRRVHTASTPIPANCRDSEIPLSSLQSPPHACKKQTGRLLEPHPGLFSCSKTLRQVFTCRSFHRFSLFFTPCRVGGESSYAVILTHFQDQHSCGVSGCISALKSRVLARVFLLSGVSIWVLQFFKFFAELFDT